MSDLINSVLKSLDQANSTSNVFRLDTMRASVAQTMFANEEAVSEETEQIDELSTDTLNSYRDQAVDHKEKLKNNIARKTDHVQQMNDMGRDASNDKAELSAAEKLLKNRRAGIDKAGEKIAQK